MDNLKKVLKQFPYLYNIAFMFFIYGGRQMSFKWKQILRYLGIDHSYDKLKEFKGKHDGERCFIVGTGPSLKMSDLDLIKNEYSFSVNSIVLSFKDTAWRPTYYVIQDRFGYEKIKDTIKIAKMPYIFNGISNKRMTPRMDIDNISFPLNLLDHGKAIPKHITKFSMDAFKVVYAGHSVTYSAIELATYMGFKEIILLGVDCDYSKKVNHVKAYHAQDDNNAAYLMRESFKVAREYAKNNGIKILDATRNGKLDVFEIVDLENIIG